MSLLCNFDFNKEFLVNISKNNYTCKGKPNLSDNGMVFSKGDALEIPLISLKGDYTISCWFKTPLPENIENFSSLCSAGWDSKIGVPVLVQRKDNHLGVFHETKWFRDSSFSLDSLPDGKHHLIAIGDEQLSQTLFYINNSLVGKSDYKISKSISQIGNNGNENVEYPQPFGYVKDFRILNKQLSYSERQKLFNQPIKKNNDIVIDFNGVSKSYKFYHEKRTSLYEYLGSFLKKKPKHELLTVLNDISFSVKKGEMLGIIGYNGSGKTTILKLISKIYYPNSGTITTVGKITPLLELGVGFNSELTAKENIVLYGLFLGFTKSEIKNKIAKIIKFAELENFLDVKLKNFSTGMHARLAFSTASQVNPDILLVDEVLSVGDVHFQQKSFDEFMKFKKNKKTIVFVSHNLEQVAKYCDKVLWLHNGNIQEYGLSNAVVNSFLSYSQLDNS